MRQANLRYPCYVSVQRTFRLTVSQDHPFIQKALHHYTTATSSAQEQCGHLVVFLLTALHGYRSLLACTASSIAQTREEASHTTPNRVSRSE